MISPIAPDLKRIVLDELALSQPELWARCYPRIYEDIRGGQYASAKDIACDMVGAAVKVEGGFLGENEKAEIVWASKLAGYRVPTYWLTHDIAEALKQTTPPAVLDLAAMKLPFEAAVFMLPKGTLVHESDEGEAAFLSYVRTTVGEEIRSLARKGPQHWRPLQNGAITIFAHTTAEHLLHWTIPTTEHVDLAHLDQLIQSFEGAWQHHRSSWPFGTQTMSDADNRFMARVCHLLLGTLVLMLARPDIVTSGLLRKRVQKRDQPTREFWSPNIIGQHYKLRHLYLPQGGTHASPRGHWVRGFYREQAYGPKRSERKEIWIEPFWRGGE